MKGEKAASILSVIALSGPRRRTLLYACAQWRLRDRIDCGPHGAEVKHLFPDSLNLSRIFIENTIVFFLKRVYNDNQSMDIFLP